MLEDEIQADVMALLKARGVFHWRQHVGGIKRSGRGRVKNPMKGFPDLAGLYHGQFFVIELKRSKGGRYSPAQLDWHAKLEAEGAMVIRATSVDDVVEGLLTLEEAR